MAPWSAYSARYEQAFFFSCHVVIPALTDFVQESYRRRGLAKTLAAKLFREGTSRYGPDGWSSADVSADNEGSRGMCRRLNGKPHWVVSWYVDGDPPPLEYAMWLMFSFLGFCLT